MTNQIKPFSPQVKLRCFLVFILGSIVAALNAAWMSYMEVVWNQGFATLLSIYYNVVFTLVIFLLVNFLIKRYRPTLALSRPELLCFFIMGTMGTSIAMMTVYLVSVLAFPFYDATHNNPEWVTELLPLLPQKFTVSNELAVNDFYLGAKDVTWRSIRHWLTPFLIWGVFLIALVWTGICMSAIVYNRWRRQEHLTFPLNQIPLMMTDENARFFRPSLFWLGFGIAALIDVNNFLSLLTPVFTMIPVKQQVFLFNWLGHPWDALNPVFYSLNPMLLGLLYFLPLDLLFSIFFFYWAGRFQGVFLNYTGAEVRGTYGAVPEIAREQAFGAMLALLFFSFWIARGQWKESWSKYQQFMQIKSAFTGALIGTLVMIAILIAGGMPVYLAVLFIIIYLLVVLALARIRAQYGAPNTGLLLTAPGQVLYNTFGKGALDTHGLSSLSLTHWAGREFSGQPMLSTPENISLSEGRMTPRLTITIILLSAFVGYAAAYGTVVMTGYNLGHDTAKAAGLQMFFGNEAYSAFNHRLAESRVGPSFESMGAVGFGAIVTLILQSLRTQFVGLPLHPVGYAISGTYISVFMWSTTGIMWLFKLLLLRYTGLKGYYRMAPFFLGLLLGECVIGSLGIFVGFALGIRPYVIWPY